jgi:bla regulator protein BlaR1
MLAWMGYSMVVGLLLAGAGWACEQAAIARRLPLRWLWAASMACTLLLPMAMNSLQVELPALMAGGSMPRTVALRDLAAPSLTPRAWVPPAAQPILRQLEIDAQLGRGWLAMSAMLALVSIAGVVWMGWRARSWQRHRIAGVVVWVSADMGPAAHGVLRPRIVVPRWLLDGPASQQALVLAHEQSHVNARDPLLLALGLLALVAMPWNVALWWQARRLQRAIEIDCDARVLAQGHSVQQYGSTLIDIGERQCLPFGAVAAMAASRSLLAQRIGMMTRPAKRRFAPLFALLALGMAAAAAQVGPPAMVRHEVSISHAVVNSYVGYYQLSDYEVIILSQAGERLIWQVNHGRSFVMSADSETSFFSPQVDLQLEFPKVAPGQGVPEVMMRQLGVEMHAKRVEASVVQAIDEAIKQRVADQRPLPNGAALLRRNLELARHGQLQRDDFTHDFGALLQRTLPGARKEFEANGDIRSIKFRSVDIYGADIYDIEFEHGRATCWITENAAGKVTFANYRKS